MYCGPGNPQIVYHMEDQDRTARPLVETALEKYLGVNVTNTLKPTVHCQKAANKAMSALRLIHIAFSNINLFVYLFI